MRKPDIDRQELMRISELAKATGVSLPTIHYYTREGLLFPALKTAHNMAYYSHDCVNDIQLIKELQTKKFLPLSVIKLILRAKREGQDLEHVAEMESVLSDIFQPVDDAVKSRSLSLPELVSVSGLTESVIKALEAKKLIIPIENEHGCTYDDIDIRIAHTIKKLIDFGLKLDDLDIFSQQIELFRTEVRDLHDKIHSLPNHENIPLKELLKAIKELKEYSETRIIRQETEHFREDGLQGEEE